MPARRREWAKAMHAEAHYLPGGAATRWAFGCLIAAIKARFAPMHTGSFRVSRWIMLVETLGCFGTALLAWFEFTFGPSGVVRLNSEVIEKYFLVTPGGGYILGLMIGFAVTGLVAPIGIFLGLRYVLKGRALENRRLGWALIAAPVLQSLAGSFGFLWVGTDGWGTGLELFVLCTLLPVVAILHLMYLARPAAPFSGAGVATS
jgi:hypothetical protein